MIPEVKKCHNLDLSNTDIDSHCSASCRSTHVCYRTVCYSDLFTTVLHLGSQIYKIDN